VFGQDSSTLGADVQPHFLWISSVTDTNAGDQYAAFRGTLDLDRDCEVEFRLLGASWFGAWLDGEFFAEGPSRFPVAFPQYQTFIKTLKAGRHVLAVQVHYEGVPTRMMENQLPFLYAIACRDGQEIPLRWKCSAIRGYTPKLRRINPQLGWVEWCDTRLMPDWQSPTYVDQSWSPPVMVERTLGALQPLDTANPQTVRHELKAVAAGRLVELFGYETDNPAARFFLRDLAAKDHPPQGVWRRYDLGRVRLMQPKFVLDLPAGAVVEFAYAESLTRGRVAPWITLSAGDSCNLDHYVARGGRQEFFPLTPKGGRFLEVHVIAPPDQVKFLKEEYLERGYYGEPNGAFHCHDELLNRIWSVGVETHRACAEDTLIDNPTRERGEWAGDVVTVGMDIAGVAFSDLRLCRRGLGQCAQCARQDGLIAGMCPGQGIYLSTYAAQWVTACVHYWELTGDRKLLEELFPAAEKNLAAFEAQRTPDGLKDALGWGFVDWGYIRNPGASDMAVNLHYLAALQDMERWCAALGKSDRAEYYQRIAAEVRATLNRYYEAEFKAGGDAWARIGYHRAVLGLRLGFFAGARAQAGVAAIKTHMLHCFPNDPSAPRLSDPGANNPRLITPYFAHYAMPLLIERGEMDFVLDQYRKCWGWALGDGRTTWLEVFDTRWSHCHQWAGCPTWQLSRYVLGLQPRQDLGINHFVLALHPGSLTQAEGRIPLPGLDKTIKVEWRKRSDGIHFSVETPVPIVLHIPGKSASAPGRVVAVEREFTETIQP
jgi:hypothetical protein